MNENDSRPHVIDGGLHVDARGSVAFVNDFDFKNVDRFYYVRAAEPYHPRGWIGHKREKKHFTVVQGDALVAVVRPDDFETPSRDLPVQRFTLSAENPHVLCVPEGHATASMMLSDDAILMIFSSGRIEDAADDDYRFPEDTWPIETE